MENKEEILQRCRYRRSLYKVGVGNEKHEDVGLEWINYSVNEVPRNVEREVR